MAKSCWVVLRNQTIVQQRRAYKPQQRPFRLVFPHRNIVKYWRALIVIIHSISCPEKKTRIPTSCPESDKLLVSASPIFLTILHPTLKLIVCHPTCGSKKLRLILHSTNPMLGPHSYFTTNFSYMYKMYFMVI